MSTENLTIEVVLNGEPSSVANGLTVSGLIEKLELKDQRVAVEYNLSILSQPSWELTVLHAGDRLEIVHFVGGG